MSKKLLDINPLLEALSLIIAHTSVEQKEFVTKFRHSLVHTVKQEFPESSIAEISQKIGMLRGTISECLACKEQPKVAPSNEMHILNELWKIKDDKGLVDIKGVPSFYSIARKQLVGKHSPETALNTLIDAESLERINDHQLLVKSRKMLISQDEKQLIRILGEVFLKLVRTVFDNTKSTNKKYQNTIATTNVPPESIESLHNQVFYYLKHTTMVDLRRIFESFETHDNGHYPEYSISTFEYF